MTTQSSSVVPEVPRPQPAAGKQEAIISLVLAVVAGVLFWGWRFLIAASSFAPTEMSAGGLYVLVFIIVAVVALLLSITGEILAVVSWKKQAPASLVWLAAGLNALDIVFVLFRLLRLW